MNDFFRHLVGDQVVTQIFFDFDAFEARIRRENGKRLVVDNGVERNDGTDQSFVQRESCHPFFRQHRRLKARRVDG